MIDDAYPVKLQSLSAIDNKLKTNFKEKLLLHLSNLNIDSSNNKKFPDKILNSPFFLKKKE